VSTATVAVWRVDSVEVVAPPATVDGNGTSAPAGLRLPPQVKPEVAASPPAAASCASAGVAIRYSPRRRAARSS
jgi:hypothetical protein